MRPIMFVMNFFRKYGFQDGDNEQLMQFARRIMPEVFRWIAEEMPQGCSHQWLNLEVVEVPHRTLHNPLRAQIDWWERHDGEMAQCSWIEGETWVNLGAGGVVAFGHTHVKPEVKKAERFDGWIRKALKNAEERVQQKYGEEIKKIPMLT